MFSQLIMTVKGVLLLWAAVYGFAALLRSDDAKWIRDAPLKIFVGLYVIAMWAHIVWVPYLASIFVIAYFAKTRADAARIYVITIFALPVLYYKVAIGSHYLFPVSKYTFCAVGLLIAFLARKNTAVRLKQRLDFPIAILIVLEIARARDPDIATMARQLLPVLLTIAMPYYLVSRSLNTTEDVRKFTLAMALGGFVLAAVALVEARTHWLVYKQAEGYLGLINADVNPYTQIRGGSLRAPGSFAESTALGAFLAIAAIAVLALKSSFASRGKWLAALAVVLVGLIAPNSRNALIGVAIGVLLFDFYRKKWGQLFIKLGAVGAGYVMLLVGAQFSPLLASLIGQGEDTQSSSDYRMLLLQRGMEEIHKNPILGTTLKKAMDNLQDIQQSQHIIDLVNSYVTYGLIFGYTGMVGIFLVFITPAVAMILARRKLSASTVLFDQGAFVFAVAGLMTVIAAFTYVQGENSTYFYLVVMLGSTLWALRRTAGEQLAGDGTTVAPSVRSPLRSMILADRDAARARAAASSPA